MKRKTNDRSCEERDARRLERLQDEHPASTRKPIIPVVGRSNSSFYIAFGAVQVFLILISSVLGLHANLIYLVGSKTFFCATYSANNWPSCDRVNNCEVVS